MQDVSRQIKRVAALAAFGMATSAAAQAIPADCSNSAIPDEPLVVRLAGAAEVPLPVMKFEERGAIGFERENGEKASLPTFGLVMKDRISKRIFDPVGEISVGVLVGEGQTVDGRIFRLLPAVRDTPEDKAQERLEGQPVFQSWSVKIPTPGGPSDSYAIDVNAVFYIASARVEFFKRTGNKLPGKIHLCVPGNQKGGFDEPPNRQVEVIGSFIADVE